MVSYLLAATAAMMAANFISKYLLIVINELMKSNNHIEMDGPGVLHFGISKVIKEINTLIDGEDSLDIFPHQAGKIMLETLNKKIKGNHTFHQNYENFGNLVSTSIPNLLEQKFNVFLRMLYCSGAARGPVAQWIRHRPTELGIAGSLLRVLC